MSTSILSEWVRYFPTQINIGRAVRTKRMFFLGCNSVYSGVEFNRVEAADDNPLNFIYKTERHHKLNGVLRNK
jgi:hypothetical protein